MSPGAPRRSLCGLEPGGTIPESSWGARGGLAHLGSSSASCPCVGQMQKHLAWLRICGSQGTRAEERSLRLEGAAGGQAWGQGAVSLVDACRRAGNFSSGRAPVGEMPRETQVPVPPLLLIHPSARWAQPGHRRPLRACRVSLGSSTAQGSSTAPEKLLSLLKVDFFSSKLCVSCVCSCPEMPHDGDGSTGARWDLPAFLTS